MSVSSVVRGRLRRRGGAHFVVSGCSVACGIASQVIKSKRPFTMQAKVEVNILELLRERDPEGKYNCGETQD